MAFMLDIFIDHNVIHEAMSYDGRCNNDGFLTLLEESEYQRYSRVKKVAIFGCHIMASI